MGHVRGVSTERGSDGGIANGQVKKIANLFLGYIGQHGQMFRHTAVDVTVTAESVTEESYIEE